MRKYITHTEKELILLLQQNDTDALSDIYFIYVKQLKYFVLKAAKSTALMEDVVHDTFIKIWESRMSIDPEQPIKPYLYTVARRHLLNLLKRAQHEHSIVDEIQKYAVTAEHSTELSIQYNESNSILNEAISSLPPQCREVFIRCKIRGLSHKQTAAELGISESTVNNQMGKALKVIKEFINVYYVLALILAAIVK